MQMGIAGQTVLFFPIENKNHSKPARTANFAEERQPALAMEMAGLVAGSYFPEWKFNLEHFSFGNFLFDLAIENRCGKTHG